MIRMAELNRHGFVMDKVQQDNINILLERMNNIRLLYGIAMIITSGYRSKDDHIRIYKDIAKRKGVEFDLSKVPMGSQHLQAAACDVLDSDGKLMQWCRDNVHHLEAIGLWIEDDTSVPRVHFQIYPPKSQSRFFKP